MSAAASIADLPLAEQYAISAAIGKDQSSYHAVVGATAISLGNTANGFHAQLQAGVLDVSAGTSDWQMALTKIGRGDSLQPMAEPLVQAGDNRVDCDYGPIDAWYVNGPLGLQQGFTIPSPEQWVGNAASEPLTVELALGGNLTAAVNATSDGLTLARADGSTALSYGGLVAYDATGTILPAWMEVRADAGGQDLLIHVNDAGGQGPVTIDPFVQSAKLTAANEAYQNFGRSVAISDDTVVVGDIGAAYVFTRPTSGWMNMTHETAKLTALDGNGNNFSVDSVAFSGDTVVVGSSYQDWAAAYVFTRPSSVWTNMTTETARLTAADGTGFFPDSAVAISGDTVVLGVHVADVGGNNLQGAVYVFTKTGSIWASMTTPTATLTASDGAALDMFGGRVAISGDTIVVGEDHYSFGSSVEAAYVFTKPGSVWANMHETAKLTVSNGGAYDHFGQAVAISGDTVVVGAPSVEVVPYSAQGAAYVFTKPGSAWVNTSTPTARLTANDGAQGDYFGTAVGISGDTVVVGANTADIGANGAQGAAYVYTRPGSDWTNMTTPTAKVIAFDGAWNDRFGSSVAISGDTVVAGAIYNADHGAAYIFGDPSPVDITPPSNVDSFIATPGNGQASLAWSNPSDSDYAGVEIIRKTGSYPTNRTDGVSIYIGNGNSTTDTGLTNGTTYYYKAFSFDGVPNYSAGATASATPEASPPTADMDDPVNGGAIVLSTLNGRAYIDVTFFDAGGSGLNTSTITDVGQEFTLSGTAASGVSVNGSPTLVSGTTYRYSFTGSFAAGAVGVNFTAGTFADSAGNTNSDASESFTVTTTALPNLTPYQPAGWSDKIVVSNTTGTNTDSSPLYTTDILYVDWSVLNNSTAATGAGFSNSLYVDGSLKATVAMSALSATYYANYVDYNIGSLSVGTHTLQIVTDSGNAITESNESDNSYIKTITVQPPTSLPNLTPYQPTGWSDKIVVSKATGTNTDSSPLYTTDALYVDWAAMNNGAASTVVTFHSLLYVDGNVVGDWTTPPPFTPFGNDAAVFDWSLGSVSAGTHTLQLVIDTTGTIDESSETDNTYTKMITVVEPSRPNLAPYQPVGWSDKIVVSKTTGTNTDSSPLYATDTLYLDWAATNNGTTSAIATFYTRLYVDGNLINTWNTSPPMAPGSYTWLVDFSLGSLNAGTHTVQLVVDSTGAINESNESDNGFTKTITVATTALPNLTPYQPAGWSDKIVVSNTTGTNTDSSPLYTTDTLYLDWAASNLGAVSTAATYYSALYLDGNFVYSWYRSVPLNPASHTWISDYSLGSLSAGTHTVQIVIDSTNAIDESDETDNTYTRTITFTTTALPNLTPYQPAGWSDKIVVSNTTGTNTDSSPLYTTDTLYLDWAATNNGAASVMATFYYGLYLDGNLITTWNTAPPVVPGAYTWLADYSLGSLSAGTHTLQIVVDSTNAISESNESDNTYTKVITVPLPPATVGLYDPAASTFYLRYANDWGNPNDVFQYAIGAGWAESPVPGSPPLPPPGPGPWKPFAGDWDGDGTDTIGLYDPATSWFHLRNSNSTGGHDVCFAYGAAGSGWIPMVGDWDGNGTVTVGLFDPEYSQFYLRNSLTTGGADVSFAYGAAHLPLGERWQPIVSDWDGNRTATVGFYDPYHAWFYLHNSHTTGSAEISFPYGAAGSNWKTVMADWNGDNGQSTMGFYLPDASHWYLSNSNEHIYADISFGFGAAGKGWLPVVGRWTGAVQGLMAVQSSQQSGVSGQESRSLIPSPQSLAPLISAALARWADAGTNIATPQVVVTDLPGSMLGEVVGNAVYLDRDAAGYGWFVDSTPAVDEEFARLGGETQLRAVDPQAVDRIDLLTVVEHELGHLAGLSDLDASLETLMSGALPAGVRREIRD